MTDKYAKLDASPNLKEVQSLTDSNLVCMYCFISVEVDNIMLILLLAVAER